MNSKSKNKKNQKTKDIQYGDVEFSQEEFLPKNVKERITIFLDQDILDSFRDRAEKEGKKYQSLINEALRESMDKPNLEERIKRLEEKIEKIAS